MDQLMDEYTQLKATRANMQTMQGEVKKEAEEVGALYCRCTYLEVIGKKEIYHWYECLLAFIIEE